MYTFVCFYVKVAGNVYAVALDLRAVANVTAVSSEHYSSSLKHASEKLLAT